MDSGTGRTHGRGEVGGTDEESAKSDRLLVVNRLTEIIWAAAKLLLLLLLVVVVVVVVVVVIVVLVHVTKDKLIIVTCAVFARQTSHQLTTENVDAPA